MIFSDEPEVFLPKYSQPAILHAAHFRWEVNDTYSCCSCTFKDTFEGIIRQTVVSMENMFPNQICRTKGVQYREKVPQ